MVDITHKSNSLRTAIAAAVINVSKEETIEAVRNKTVPKGDVFEFSRAAGLLAIKKRATLFRTAIHYQSNMRLSIILSRISRF
jgi:molybdenum cofactor biosynthesis enzyme